LFDDHGLPFAVTDLTADKLEASGRYSKERIRESHRKYGMDRLNAKGALEMARRMR